MVRFGKIFHLIHLGRDCFPNLTHAANIESQPNACSSCFKQNFPCLLGGENIYNYLIKHLPVLITLLNSLPVLVASVKDTPGETLVHKFVHNKYFPARWVSRKLSPKSKTISCLSQIASSRLVYCSSIQCPVCECIWFCNVTPDLYRETTCVSRNYRTAWFKWLLNPLQ